MATRTQKPSRTAAARSQRRPAVQEVDRIEGEYEGSSDLEITDAVRKEVDTDSYIKSKPLLVICSARIAHSVKRCRRATQ